LDEADEVKTANLDRLGAAQACSGSCAKFYAADESLAPSEPKRAIKMENSAVEFTANDGKRVRLSW
jgi:hypothetical protein